MLHRIDWIKSSLPENESFLAVHELGLAGILSIRGLQILKTELTSDKGSSKMYDSQCPMLEFRGEQNIAGADPTNPRQWLHPDTSVDQLSQGRCSEGEFRSDAGAMRSLDQRILHRSTSNWIDPGLPVSFDMASFHRFWF